MAVIARDNVTGLIYAGGRATRMGGVDKGLELFRGRPLTIEILSAMPLGGIRLFAIWMMLLPDRSPLWLQLGLKTL